MLPRCSTNHGIDPAAEAGNGQASDTRASHFGGKFPEPDLFESSDGLLRAISVGFRPQGSVSGASSSIAITRASSRDFLPG